LAREGILLDVRAVTKNYGGLRPLRIERLTVLAGQHVALVGLDQPMAEVFINLVTGATLPDTGEIVLFGRATGAIHTSDDWLSVVEGFGIVSDRAVLLEGLSVVQNLAMPFSLDIDPPSAALRDTAVRLGREVGLSDAIWDQPLGGIDPAAELRVRLARALALEPAIVILEHPTARMPREEVPAIGRSIREIVGRRGLAAVTLTADRAFADAAAGEVLTLDPATGRLRRASWWRSS
jgi:ABC-type transporter Mla maintaining outer membrane lipid asymmetry ATPase subunit MlaF